MAQPAASFTILQYLTKHFSSLIVSFQIECGLIWNLALGELQPSVVSKEEMAFGNTSKKPGISVLMRNWVLEQQCNAYHSGKAPKLGQARHVQY